MPKEFKPEQVINGTWGEAWLDGEYLAQVTALKAEVTPKKTAIAMVQRLNEGQKMTGLELKGEIKLHKINSTIMRKMSESIPGGGGPLYRRRWGRQETEAIHRWRETMENGIFQSGAE